MKITYQQVNNKVLSVQQKAYWEINFSILLRKLSYISFFLGLFIWPIVFGIYCFLFGAFTIYFEGYNRNLRFILLGIFLIVIGATYKASTYYFSPYF